jgi:hypothetical protein
MRMDYWVAMTLEGLKDFKLYRMFKTSRRCTAARIERKNLVVFRYNPHLTINGMNHLPQCREPTRIYSRTQQASESTN